MQNDGRLWYSDAAMAGIEVSGPDAADFLQSQFSQDLRIGDGQVVYGLWLDHRGKILADSWVMRREAERFWVVSRHSAQEVIMGTLDAHLIADEVELKPLQSLAWITVWQEDLPAAGQLKVEAGGVVAWAGHRSDRVATLEVLVPAEKVDEWIAEAGLAAGDRLSEEVYHRRRILAGIPEVPGDAGAGHTPLDAQLETVAVSFDKGCYLGQEVVTRLHRMERAGGGLYRVEGKGALPQRGASILAGERVAGELNRTVRSEDGDGWCGLAVVRRKLVDEGIEMTVDAAAVRISPASIPAN